MKSQLNDFKTTHCVISDKCWLPFDIVGKVLTIYKIIYKIQNK